MMVARWMLSFTPVQSDSTPMYIVSLVNSTFMTITVAT